MQNNTNCTEYYNGHKFISQPSLEQLLVDRDKRIERIELATATMKKLRQAKTREEYESISIPEEYRMFGEDAIRIMNSFVSGFAMDIATDCPRCHYGNMESIVSFTSSTLFRGEIQDFGTTSGYSSLGRTICREAEGRSAEDRLFSFFVGQLRRICFWEFLLNFRQYIEFPYGETLDGLIAQHYGLATSFIDLTDDIKVALFFACCIPVGNNQYRPITQKDIAQIGKVGVIYGGQSNLTRIIGFQPFCRCHRQRGYYIDTAAINPCWEYKLGKEVGFEKCYFDRTVELSEWLYSEFDGGKKLFPDDGLEPFSEIIAQIACEHSFSFDTFDVACKVFFKYLESYRRNNVINNECINMFFNKDYLKAKMIGNGFVLCKSKKLKVNEALIEKMNNNWDPDEFACKEGFVYSPFIFSVD